MKGRGIMIIKQAIKELVLPAILILLIGSVALCVSCYNVSLSSAICYPIEIWIEGCTVVDFFLPLLVSVPFSASMYMKKKNNFINYAAVRIEKKKYLRYQKIAGIMLVIGITFLMYFISLILSVFVFFNESNTDRTYIVEYMFGRYQADSPIVFGAVWCFWKGIVASLFTYFGYQLALSLDNLFAIAISPFIYVMAENLITGIIQIPQYSIMTSYVLNRLSPSVMHIWNFFAGIVSFLLITSAIIVAIKKKRGKQYDGLPCD